MRAMSSKLRVVAYLVTNFLILLLNGTLNMFLKTFEAICGQCSNRILIYILDIKLAIETIGGHLGQQ